MNTPRFFNDQDMMPVKIGFLSPYSSIYPFYSAHMASGFYQGLNQDPNRSDIQLIPEFAGTGGRNAVIDAAKKLLQFSHVDILSGMINYKILPDLVPLIGSMRKMALFYDLGEMMPLFDTSIQNVFFNSHQLYQSEYALGYWAHKEFRNTGMVLTPIYNTGFHLHRGFEFGVGDAGGTEIIHSTIPYKEEDPHHLDIDYAFDMIHKESPAYVHAIFVGPQGNEFLAKWKSYSWTRDIPLIVAENMLYEDMLGDVSNLGLEMYGAMLWNERSENGKNQFFVKRFRELTGQPANLYALLGYETGLLFKEMLKPLKKRQWDKVSHLMATTTIEGPRGPKSFALNGEHTLPKIDIVKVNTRGVKQQHLVVESGKHLLMNNPRLKEGIALDNSGWLNPYLCI